MTQPVSASSHAHDHEHHDHDHHHHHHEQITWRDWTQAGVLLGLGAYFAFLIASGTISNYINLRFISLIYIGSGIFLLLGGWQAFRLLRLTATEKPKRGDEHHHHDHAHDHDHNHGQMSILALLLCALPLILAVAVPSRPLGAEAVSGGVSLEPIGVASVNSYELAPEDRNVLDWLREYARVENPAELNGLPVDVIAFVYREPGMTDTQFMAARFTVSCCVADAFAVGLPVEYADAPSLDEGAWVRVRGTLQAGEFDGERIPIIQPESVEPADQPDTPYLFS
jgi:uncharacterized repeat protein (TIGR03943 family)